MAKEFYNYLRFNGPGTLFQTVALSIRVYLGGDVEELPESSDDSVTLTSQDDAGNQTLFLFRFWVTAEHPNVQFARHVLERDVNEESLKIMRDILVDNGVDPNPLEVVPVDPMAEVDFFAV